MVAQKKTNRLDPEHQRLRSVKSCDFLHHLERAHDDAHTLMVGSTQTVNSFTEMWVFPHMELYINNRKYRHCQKSLTEVDLILTLVLY